MSYINFFPILITAANHSTSGSSHYIILKSKSEINEAMFMHVLYDYNEDRIIATIKRFFNGKFFYSKFFYN